MRTPGVDYFALLPEEHPEIKRYVANHISRKGEEREKRRNDDTTGEVARGKRPIRQNNTVYNMEDASPPHGSNQDGKVGESEKDFNEQWPNRFGIW